MKISTILRALSVVIAVYAGWFAAGCSGAACENPPDVEGTYDMTATTCPAGLFDTVIRVVQNQCDVTLEATTAGFLDAEGTIDDDGNFEVENANGTCEGEIRGDTGTATCTSNEGDRCELTYERR